jgi:hypothetical protein
MSRRSARAASGASSSRCVSTDGASA